ncbi:GGDEF domain-containing protein [Halobacillus yeomjeoni]|uniref:Diguanylate cyclase n=1 Tax=Halobacillus yeomjeoni TaxID=311194 RepID=A0A931HW97_9BACI|nr:GGDEF domain-containing protein [Halobacillus yeomjeoni]MBH0230704.1 diguanylate cyclase [Halobacillus yeomjeoni]
MIGDFIINVSILVTFLFLYFQFLQTPFIKKQKKIVKTIFIGVAGAVLTFLLMTFSIQANPTTIIDLRHIPLLISAIFGGWLSLFITWAANITIRFSMGINPSSISNLIGMTLISLAYIGIHLKVHDLWKKTFVMILTSNTIFLIMTYSLIPDKVYFLRLNLIFWPTLFAAGFFTVYLFNFMKKIHHKYDEYEKFATKDPLTGLFNVRKFDETMNELTHSKQRQPFSLLVIDIDHFKNINDTYGHPNGDQVLQQLARLLQESCRPTDFVFRNGGEEFTIILKDCPHHSAGHVAETIRKSISSHSFDIDHERKNITLTVSIGVAVFPYSSMNTDGLYKLADLALYEAKNSGRNKVKIYHPGTDSVPLKIQASSK